MISVIYIYCLIFISTNYKLPFLQMRDVDKHYIKPITKCENSTQTDTHILPPTTVRSYEWNEWELRRKAIRLVCNSFF